MTAATAIEADFNKAPGNLLFFPLPLVVISTEEIIITIIIKSNSLTVSL